MYFIILDLNESGESERKHVRRLRYFIILTSSYITLIIREQLGQVATSSPASNSSYIWIETYGNINYMCIYIDTCIFIKITCKVEKTCSETPTISSSPLQKVATFLVRACSVSTKFHSYLKGVITKHTPSTGESSGVSKIYPSTSKRDDTSMKYNPNFADCLGKNRLTRTSGSPKPQKYLEGSI